MDCKLLWSLKVTIMLYFYTQNFVYLIQQISFGYFLSDMDLEIKISISKIFGSYLLQKFDLSFFTDKKVIQRKTPFPFPLKYDWSFNNRREPSPLCGSLQ